MNIVTTTLLSRTRCLHLLGSISPVPPPPAPTHSRVSGCANTALWRHSSEAQLGLALRCHMPQRRSTLQLSRTSGERGRDAPNRRGQPKRSRLSASYPSMVISKLRSSARVALSSAAVSPRAIISQVHAEATVRCPVLQRARGVAGNDEFSGSIMFDLLPLFRCFPEVWRGGGGRFGLFLCHSLLLALAFHPPGWGLVSDSGTMACLELLW